jgi:hypothetical protein
LGKRKSIFRLGLPPTDIWAISARSAEEAEDWEVVEEAGDADRAPAPAPPAAITLPASRAAVRDNPPDAADQGLKLAHF